MSELLLELFSEEIPARMQDGARVELNKFAGSVMRAVGQDSGQASAHVTARRLALVINNLPSEIAASSEERRGPRVGAPEQAMAGFLKSTGLTREQLTERDGYYYAIVKKPAVPVAEVVKPAIEEMLKNFPWPKSMRWGNGDVNWVRPLKNILCTLDGKVLPVEFAGLKANNITYGHRFLAPAKIEVQDFTSYENALKKAYVVIDAAERRKIILEQAQRIAVVEKGELRPDEQTLLAEVTGLAEYPVVLSGSFDEEFLSLPPEVLITSMRSHQKYFAVQKSSTFGMKYSAELGIKDINDRQDINYPLLPRFIFVSNMQANDGGKAIIEGNQRVLRARLADARFFLEQDSKIPLEEMAKKLSQITFHAKLGTIAEKVARMKNLAAALAEKIPDCDKNKAIKAAELCKADLVSGMVGEFPELQGIMGRYYALGRKVDAEIADAIRDHYSPQGQNDSVPTAPVSICVALADKIDTLTGMFAVGEKPTGSKDPFALRRAALGVLRIILENNIRINLSSITYKNSLNLYEDLLKDFAFEVAKDCMKDAMDRGFIPTVEKGTFDPNLDSCKFTAGKSSAEIILFFIDRLKVMMKDSGFSHDIIEAALMNGKDDDVVRIIARAAALRDFLKGDDGKNLLAGYKRAANILKAEEKKSSKKYDGAVEQGALAESPEKSLHGALLELQKATAPLAAAENFSGQMTALAKLRQPVDEFFEKVMVNVDDEKIRINRLNLLGLVRSQIESIANFSVIEG